MVEWVSTGGTCVISSHQFSFSSLTHFLYSVGTEKEYRAFRSVNRVDLPSLNTEEVPNPLLGMEESSISSPSHSPGTFNNNSPHRGNLSRRQQISQFLLLVIEKATYPVRMVMFPSMYDTTVREYEEV